MNFLVEEVFSPSSDVHVLYSLVPPSPYETAWVGMIPDPNRPTRPLFPEYLDWIMRNQREGGFWFWGDEPSDLISIDCLTATLACILAPKTWTTNTSSSHNIDQGLLFLRTSTNKLLRNHIESSSIPQWFAVIFPGLLEIAASKELEVFPDGYPLVVQHVFKQREMIFDTLARSSESFHPPLSLYLEALPEKYKDNHGEILAYQSNDGSLFGLPSATASAFIVTGDRACLQYLESMAQNCGFREVPPMYPVDQDLVKLSLDAL